MRSIPPVKKNRYNLNIFFSSFFNNGEQRLADYLDGVLLRQKKVLDRWIKKRKAKSKAKSKELRAKGKNSKL